MKGAAVAGLLIVAVLVGAGAGYLTGNANERTITSVSTSIGPTTTLTQTTTVVSTTTNSTGGQAPFVSYLTNAFGCATNTGYKPCFGAPAYLFNSCTNSSVPPAPYTCTYTWTEIPPPPNQSFSFNITLGLQGQSGVPVGDDCHVSDGIGYANCIPVINSTAFIVEVQAALAE